MSRKENGNQMKVLFIDNSPSMGGSIRNCASLAAGLAERGVETGVIASHPEFFRPLVGEKVHLATIAWEGFRNVFAPELGLFGGGLPWLGTRLAMRRFAQRVAPEIARFLREERPDLVHVNNLNLPNLPVGAAVRAAGLPLVVACQMIRAFAQRELSLARDADRVICVSEAVRRQFAGQPDLEPKTRVLYVPIEIEMLRAQADTGLRAELGLRPDTPTAVLLGRLTEWKGQHVAIEAWREVHDRLGDATLLLAGEGDEQYTARCKALTQRLNLGEAVKFLGHRNDVGRLVAGSDLVVHSSCWDNPAQGPVEALGLVVAEAMVFGKPVVATEAGGVPEVIGDSRAGMLARPGDPHSLAEAVLHYLRDPQARDQAGQRGKERVEQLFTRKTIVERLLNIYQEMLEQKH